MLFHFAQYLRHTLSELSFLRVFDYITVRSAFALLLAFTLSIILGPILIRILKRLKAGQPIRKTEGEDVRDLSEMHAAKADTPTAGGLMIMFSIIITTILCCQLNKQITWLMLIMMSGFTALGFADDYLKIRYKNSKGLPGKYKLMGQAILGLLLAANLMIDPMGLKYEYINMSGTWEIAEGYTYLSLPFLKNIYPAIGFFFIPFVIFVITATSNSVNLTDGLDGLAIGVTIINAIAFVVITYLLSRIDYAGYLMFPYIRQGGELTIILSSMVGAGLGFLWYNAHPAEIFMGDTGSLALGGTLGTVAVIMKQEFLLIIIGGIFVIEALSVLIQVGSYKLRGKRVFKMAPIHHHFERCGLHESKIIARFWIISILLALIGLGTLKLR